MKSLTYILLIVAAGIITSCGSQPESQNMVELPTIPVVTDVASSVSVEESFSASGRIEASNSANLSTRMMGNVTNLYVGVGEKVKEGQLLMTTSNADLQAKKAQVVASIRQAESGFENAEKDYQRFKSLFDKGSASQKELDNMTTRYEMAKAGLEAAKQMKNEVDAQFVFTNITAPFAGIVTNTFIKEGDLATPGRPLITVEGTTKYQAVILVPESQIIQIKKGQKANLLVKSTGMNMTGTISEVSLSAKNTGGQYLVKIDLGEVDKSILPGMFVNVGFKATKTSATSSPVIKEEALIHNGQLTGVYTLGDDNIAILRWLRLGKKSDGMVEVVSGIQSGEKYILSAQGKLYNGAKVRTQSELAKQGN